MKGLLAPQNTFLDTIATRFDGTRECGLGLRAPGEGDAREALCTRWELPLPSPPPLGVPLVAEAGSEEGEAREPLPLSCLASPQLCTPEGRRSPPGAGPLRAPGPLRLCSPLLLGAEARLPAGKLCAWLGLPPRPGQPRDRQGKAQPGQALLGGLGLFFFLSTPSLEGVRNVAKS